MSTPIRVRLSRRLATAFAVASAAGMMLVGLPPTLAHAAPGDTAQIIGGKRCDEYHLGKRYATTPPNSGAPVGSGQFEEVYDGPPGQYFYDNTFKGWDNLPAPSPGDLSAAGDTDADIAKWDAEYAKSKDADDMKRAIYARYGRFKATAKNPNIGWGNWLKNRLILNQKNNRKGSSFEAKTVRDYNLIGPDWLCEVTVEIKDKDGKVIARRKYDTYNQRTKVDFGEFKSTAKYRSKQFRDDSVVLRHKDANHDFTKSKLTVYGGEKASKGTVSKYGQLNRELQAERGTTGNPVRIYQRNATGQGVYPTTQYTKTYDVMNPNPKQGSAGPIDDLAFGSGKTPAEAKAIQRQYQAVNTRSALGRGPGGVDFTTLELQYVGNPVKGKALDYSFKAGYVDDEDTNPGYGGRAKLQLASDAMFTWLALTPDKFWVNLNPDQPDKIMDSTFAKTDAGRVLLESDFAMKADFAHAMNPNKNPDAKKFWDTAPRRDGTPCFPSVRLWIEPKPAKVREQDGGIYILDAPLKVSTEWMDVKYHPPGARVCDLTAPEKRASEALLRQFVIPRVDKEVNTGAGYADLRRVYKSRVAAEFIRQQDARKATDFRPIINSNDMGRWPLRAPNQNWTKQDTYQKYLKSLREGIDWFELRYGGKVYNQGVGGVDFSKQPEKKISKARFTVEHPSLDKTTKRSLREETGYRSTYTGYFGGNGAAKGDHGGTTPPSPTPTPTPSGKPTPQPSHTPGSPAPSSPGHHSPPATVPPRGDGGSNGDGGGLADTGTQIGLAAAAAAVLLAAGVVLFRAKRGRPGRH
ncbi:hypothetical protein [Streptomyces sp. L2]|uniref:hypothetical protein n=1 Tax=Streptomyces sp. L2 TaxID=2162665 RepID=UPI0010122C2E|nr:hypothetical protein [Streptomyces sp. L2]